MLSLILSKETEMLKNYAKELAAIAAIFGFISWGIYVCIAAPAPVAPAAKAALDKKAPAKAEPAKKADKAVKPAEPKKDPNRKKPTLKKKYADKK